MNYIITEASARDLGIISSSGVELRHSATERDIAAAALASETTLAKALETAEQMAQDVYVIDEDGDSHYVGDSATVGGTATISYSDRVSDPRMVSGRATVYGQARVSDSDEVVS